MFATGNGGGVDDDCAVDGFASSIYTIGVGSVAGDGSQPSFDEECSSKMVTAYSEGVPGTPHVVIIIF